jgi:hypothetical protein
MGLITNNSDTHVNGVLTTTGFIDSTSITGSNRVFVDSDNGKIFHTTGDNLLTLPSYTSTIDGWVIGIVNTTGDTLTINCSAGNTVNDETSVENTVAYSGLYIYKSNSNNKFVAIGTLY